MGADHVRILLGRAFCEQTHVIPKDCSLTCKEEAPAEEHHSEHEPSVSVHQSEPVPRDIKEEPHELWPSRQLKDGQEFKDAGASCSPHSSVWGNNGQEETKLPLRPHAQTTESEEQFQEGTKVLHFVLPLSSALSAQAPIQKERVQDGRENERPGPQMDRSRSSFVTSGESADLSHSHLVVPDYRCCLCDKSFSSNHHLTNHAFRIHSKDADAVCAVCGRTLESSASLNVHLHSHKGSKCCQMCGKLCKTTTALTEHVAGHAGVKLHHCHVCGKECSRKADLKIHMRIHTGEKPFCCSYCDKSFTHSGHLKKHMRSHTGERPHQCDLCGKGFLQSAHLKYHLGTHAQKY
ncbi:uncharacterized protein AB9W97_019799 isoform 2-T2 [Spinachia spinachia]